MTSYRSRRSLRAVAFVSLFAVLCAPVAAQDSGETDRKAETPAKGDDAKDPSGFVGYPEKPSVTYGHVELNGEPVWYQATAGTLTLPKGAKNDPAARIFYIAYRRTLGPVEDGHEPEFPDPATRPLTFSFNGGPGSSSVWLHLGVFGPMRVAYADDIGNPGAPPHAVVPNEFSLLGRSDFVFIDPVSTGYSRPEGDTSAKDYHGLNSDIASVAEFIRLYLGREGRWSSPRFIAGESYGTTRAAGLAAELNNTHHIATNGIILISAVLNFQTIAFDVGNDLPHVLFLPSFCAVAHYHHALRDDMQRRALPGLLDEVEKFASGEYASALMQGAALPDKDRDRIADRVAAYTGLSKDYVLRANLRPDMPRFSKELLRDRGLTVGRLDARFTGADRDDAGDSYEYDPMMAAIMSNYTESMNDYMTRTLGYKTDLRYEILTNVWPWSFAGGGDNRYVNVGERLRSAMQQLPFMRVFVASGQTDLGTPYYATEYTMNHLMLRPELRGNIELHEYPGGHMMYVSLPELADLSRDLDAFYTGTLQAQGKHAD